MSARASRAAASTALVVTMIVAALLVVGHGSDGARTVRVVFANASGLFGGLHVTIAGRRVGEVDAVRYVDGQAVVELRIEDERFWPLRRGTTAHIRFGSTIGVAARYVELALGPKSAPAIPPDGLLTRSDTFTPVEFDELFTLFDRDARGDLEGIMTDAARGLRGRAPALGRGIAQAPGALEAAADLLEQLGAEPGRLEQLVIAGDRTARAVASRDRRLRELLDSAAITFDELARRASPVTASLERLPGTLRTARATLARAQRSLPILDALVDDLRPGVATLRAVAPSARRAFATLDDVTPLASATLRRGARVTPDVRKLLQAATPLLPRLRGMLDQTAQAVACVRPYAPEIAGFFGTWAGFAKNYDAHDHYVRILINVPPFPAATPLRSQDAVRLFPGLRMAFPRPPGLNAGNTWSTDQAWFQPRCGAGPQSLDARHDPEAAR